MTPWGVTPLTGPKGLAPGVTWGGPPTPGASPRGARIVGLPRLRRVKTSAVEACEWAEQQVRTPSQMQGVRLSIAIVQCRCYLQCIGSSSSSSSSSNSSSNSSSGSSSGSSSSSRSSRNVGMSKCRAHARTMMSMLSLGRSIYFGRRSHRPLTRPRRGSFNPAAIVVAPRFWPPRRRAENRRSLFPWARSAGIPRGAASPNSTSPAQTGAPPYP